MKPTYLTNLGRALVSFFQDYLPAQRGMSAHPVRSYRDAIVLFLRFVTQHTGQPVESLEIGDLCPDRVTSFLAQLEDQRGNCVGRLAHRLLTDRGWKASFSASLRHRGRKFRGTCHCDIDRAFDCKESLGDALRNGLSDSRHSSPVAASSRIHLQIERSANRTPDQAGKVPRGRQRKCRR